MENALIIFIKNPGLGKAKTRLATTLGKEKALEIYLKLLNHTRAISLPVHAEKNLYYSDFTDLKDEWSNEEFNKHIQNQNPDLGEKMFTAFFDLYEDGKQKVVIIGSDCLELTSEIIGNAFKLLDENEAVIGPAKDGGYYSIGFNFEKLGNKSKNLLQKIFLNKNWSHDKVLLEAKNDLDSFSLTYALLPILRDVDVEADVIDLL